MFKGNTKVVGQARLTSSTPSTDEPEGTAVLPQVAAISVEMAESVREKPGPSGAAESGAKHGSCREQPSSQVFRVT